MAFLSFRQGMTTVSSHRPLPYGRRAGSDPEVTDCGTPGRNEPVGGIERCASRTGTVNASVFCAAMDIVVNGGIVHGAASATSGRDIETVRL